MPTTLVLMAIATVATSGVPGLFAGVSRAFGQRLATVMMVLGSALGLAGAIAAWVTGNPGELTCPWGLPLGQFRVAIDALSAFFLVPVFLIPALGSIYGLAYWRADDHPDNSRKLVFFYGLLAGALALVVIARDGVLFLMAWEVMALAAFFLVTTEDDHAEVRQAGWIYLVATHFASLVLFALFALLHLATGSFALTPIAPGLAPGLAAAIFLTALVGFGLKAGIMPLHVWLPSAHANAPSHVSAVMSGVLIKMGIYGLVRITGLLPDPPLWTGGLLLALGAVSGVLGVVFAIGQHDLKRLLAYHSIENIGIIVMGLGLAQLGRAMHQPAWVLLGLGGALLHVWNHGLFKSLLFLSAGSVIHATHTRQIDRLGGLGKAMPRTAILFLIGAVAICGLPPLNGFVSELLIYLGLFRTVGVEGALPGAVPAASAGPDGTVAAAFGVPVLAMIGALAVACFVKVFGATFLGEARSEDTQRAHEAPRAMLGPMVVLALCCFAIGLAPRVFAPGLERAVAGWVGSGAGAEEYEPQRAQRTQSGVARNPSGLVSATSVSSVVTTPTPADEDTVCREDAVKPWHPTSGTLHLADLAPLLWLSVLGVGLLVPIAVGFLWLRAKLRRGDYGTVGTWDCGYAAPTSRMQYTSASFAQMLVALFRRVLWPKVHRPHLDALFPGPSRFESHVEDSVLDRLVLPAFRATERFLAWFRILQQGRIQWYVLYILIIVVVLLMWL